MIHFKDRENYLDIFRLPVTYARILVLVFGVAIGVFTYFGFRNASTSLIAMIGIYASYISGSILGTFILAMFFRKVGNIGATAGFIIGALFTISLSTYLFPSLNWGWICPIGVLTTVVVGNIVSLAISEKAKLCLADNVPVGNVRNANNDGRSKITVSTTDELTFVGQRRKILAENRVEENGVVILPGKFDKPSFILLGFFFLQFVVLGLFYLL